MLVNTNAIVSWLVIMLIELCQHQQIQLWFKNVLVNVEINNDYNINLI